MDRINESLYFVKHCSVLIKGSPTKDLKIHRGLRQGDPLAPFLFLIVSRASGEGNS